MSQHAEVERVGVVGAGTMGRQIALQCALHGLKVVLYDVNEEALSAAGDDIAAWLAVWVTAGRLEAPVASQVRERIRPADRLSVMAEVDLISESVPEDPALKGSVFAALDSVCPGHTLFTTNSSSLLPSMFAQATGRPHQFAALHFHLPVWQANVVDIMGHPGTDPAMIDRLGLFARQIGQIPVVCKRERPGYVFNAMLNALNTEALALVTTGVASVNDVDRAWMGVMKTPIGPFGILDLVGLDTARQITAYWAGVTGDPQLAANAAFLESYVNQGRLGRKSGRGFYYYPEPAFEQPDFVFTGGPTEADG